MSVPGPNPSSKPDPERDRAEAWDSRYPPLVLNCSAPASSGIVLTPSGNIVARPNRYHYMSFSLIPRKTPLSEWSPKRTAGAAESAATPAPADASGHSAAHDSAPERRPAHGLGHSQNRNVSRPARPATPRATPPPLPDAEPEISDDDATAALIGNSGVKFSELALCEPLQRALSDKNYVAPSPIQAQAIPHLLNGRDLIGLAQTGTGKTAAFALPILNHIAANPKPLVSKHFRALILVPTRELAVQVAASFGAYGRYLKISHALIFGGVPEGAQIRTLQKGVDIIIATPGRLLDLHNRRYLSLQSVEIFVLDEADRMLDLGFVNDVKKIVKELPVKKQALLFSATMPQAITDLTRSLVHDAVRVEVAPVSSTAERIEQQIAFVARNDKRKLLLHTVKQNDKGLILVFVRMKHGANRLVEFLDQNGIRAEAIHGNKSQSARQRALENFRAGRSRILIATDIAARGIDVKGVALVINFDLPEEPEAYVHRIGRTARAGAEGNAIAFCDRSERSLLRSIERLTRQEIPVLKEHPFAEAAESEAFTESEDTRGRGRRSGGGGGGGGRGFNRGGPRR